MKLTLSNNAELVIQARDEQDYQQALLVADRLVQDSGGTIKVASGCDYEYWIHLCAVWYHYQRQELKDAYQQARRAV